MKTKIMIMVTVVMVLMMGINVNATEITLENDTLEYSVSGNDLGHLIVHLNCDNQDLNRVEITNPVEINSLFQTIWGPDDPEAYATDYDIDVAVWGLSYMESGEYKFNTKVYDDFGNLLFEQDNYFKVINHYLDELEKEAAEDNFASEETVSENNINTDVVDIFDPIDYTPEITISENSVIVASVSENSIDEEEDQEYFDIDTIPEQTTHQGAIDEKNYEVSTIDLVDDNEDIEEFEEEEEIVVAAPEISKIKKGKKFQLKIKAEKGSKIQISYFNGKKWKTTCKKTLKIKKSWKIKLRAYKVIYGERHYSKWVVSK